MNMLFKKIGKIKAIWRAYNDDNVLVYQMGKVGSSSLEASIAGSIHVHSLYGNSPCHVHLSQRRAGLVRSLAGVLLDAFKRLSIKSRKKVKIISVIREPVKRNYSMFFQDFPHWMCHYMNMDNHDNRLSGDDYLHEVFETAFDHFYFNEWFDKEILRLTGIDVFATKFDVDSGYQKYSNDKYELLLIEVGKINELGHEISEFVGRPVDLKRVNSGKLKWYGDLYVNFTENFDQSSEYKKKMNDTKFYKHFYGC